MSLKHVALQLYHSLWGKMRKGLLTFSLMLILVTVGGQASYPQSSEVFQNNRQRFLDQFHQQEMLNILALLNENREPTRQQLKYIRRIRSRAQKLRTIYEFFDVSHKAPATFQKFVVALGKLKDALNSNASAELYVDRLLFLLARETIAETLKDFVPASYDDYREHLKNHFKKIENLVKKEKLSIDDYHQLRKGLRDLHFLSKFLQLSKHPGPSPIERKSVLKALKKMAIGMGEIHDKIEEKMMLELEIPKSLKISKDTMPLFEKTRQVFLSENGPCINSLIAR